MKFKITKDWVKNFFVITILMVVTDVLLPFYMMPLIDNF